MKKILRNLLKAILLLMLLGGMLVLCVSAHVRQTASKFFLTPEQAATLEDVDCILVLGCYVWEDGTPSPMLQDRLAQGVALYKAGASQKLLMSGDHGQQTYDEVHTMKQYALDNGVASEDVFMDHAGFSTYESAYRAKEVFGAERILIVTQRYHLYRAVYDARHLGLDAYGVAAADVNYGGQAMRDLREELARFKDMGYCIIKPKPAYLGETIPISGSGELTHDETSNFS